MRERIFLAVVFVAFIGLCYGACRALVPTADPDRGRFEVTAVEANGVLVLEGKYRVRLYGVRYLDPNDSITRLAWMTGAIFFARSAGYHLVTENGELRWRDTGGGRSSVAYQNIDSLIGRDGDPLRDDTGAVFVVLQSTGHPLPYVNPAALHPGKAEPDPAIADVEPALFGMLCARFEAPEGHRCREVTTNIPDPARASPWPPAK